jgi:hypothetical protein
LAFEVQRNAAICTVHLSRAKLAGELPDEPPKGRIVISFSTKSRQVPAPKGKLRVEVAFHMSGDMEAKSSGKALVKTAPVVTFECTYALDYELREGFEPSVKQVRAFKDGNVIFNCWPYFREYLQESIQRMGFPPVTAPFLRVQPKPPQPTKKTKRKLAEG